LQIEPALRLGAHRIVATRGIAFAAHTIDDRHVQLGARGVVLETLVLTSGVGAFVDALDEAVATRVREACVDGGHASAVAGGNAVLAFCTAYGARRAIDEWLDERVVHGGNPAAYSILGA
jgi:hypothetical protein